MCRILEAITRNYKHQTEQDPYQRGLADILTGYEKDSDEVTTSVAESSSVFYTPIDTAERESECTRGCMHTHTFTVRPLE